MEQKATGGLRKSGRLEHASNVSLDMFRIETADGVEALLTEDLGTME
jgi:hypothetical protein